MKFITLKWGKKYGPEYVNRLFSTISNTFSGKFEFYCFTDDSAGVLCDTIDINTLPHFKSNIFTVCKIDLFNGLPFEGPYVLLDLDILIQKDLNQYFEQYQFVEPRLIYNYWTNPERIYRSYYTSDCYINSSFVTWNGNQLQWLYDKFINHEPIINYKFKSFDKFMYYSSLDQLKFHPKKTVYAYCFGAENPEDMDQLKYREDYSICLFHTSHGIPKGVELHQADGWAKEMWHKYDN